MQVIHEGYLERCTSESSSSKKQYKKFYFVFKREANSGTKTLEYFKDSNWKKNEPKGVCNVYAGYSVNVISQTKRKMIFELVTIDKTYELQAASEQIGVSWVNLLNDGLFIRTFNVTLVQYPPSAQALIRNLVAAAQLKISDCSVCLLGYGCPSITWRFSAIRKYKLHNGNIVLEVGSRSMTGEGEFRFDTSDPKLVYETIDKAIKNRIKAKGISKDKVTDDKSSHPISHPETESNVTASRQLKNRTQSQGPLVHPPSPVENGSYDHLDSIRANVNPHPGTQDDLYDKLNNTTPYKGGKRHSEPAINSDSFLTSNRIITGKSMVPPVAPPPSTINSSESLEDYVSMDDGVDDVTKGNITNTSNSTRPQKIPTKDLKETKKVPLFPPKPPPRVKPKDNTAKNEAKNTTPFSGLSVTVETLSSDDTYDHANNIPRSAKAPADPGDNVYNHLFEKNNSVFNIKTSGKHVEIPHATKIPETSSIQPNQSPTKIPVLPKGAFIHAKVSKSNTSGPLKPVRPAPKPPNSLNIRKNDTSTGIVEQPLYDIPKPTSPATSPSEYNEVGDIIAGEYVTKHSLEDDEGYVEVPSSNQDAIYQVPRE